MREREGREGFWRFFFIEFCFIASPFISITNLKYWGHSETIIAKTLGLLNDLSANYACVRKLVNFEEIQFILNNHTVSESD